MMRHKGSILAIMGALFIVMIWMGSVTAQDEVIVIDHKEIFKDMKRPAVTFPHEIHEDALADEGCGVCHHVLDKKTDTLVYEEGEEEECGSCHGEKKQGQVLALKDAFHKSCTGCHRRMKKNDPTKKGPTTCGECHPKHSK